MEYACTVMSRSPASYPTKIAANGAAITSDSSSLRLRRPKWDGGALRRACTNGVSELMSSISMSIVGMLYNAQLMRYAGENGVAAYGTIMYVDFIFLAIFIGYATGVAPVISYHYGAGNKPAVSFRL